MPHEAIAAGTGPHAPAGAVTLALAGRPVTVLDTQSRIGGGARSAELTIPAAAGHRSRAHTSAHLAGAASPFCA